MTKPIKPDIVSINDKVFKRMKIPDPNKLKFISCGSLVGMGLGSLMKLPLWVSIILITLGIISTIRANPFVDL